MYLRNGNFILHLQKRSSTLIPVREAISKIDFEYIQTLKLPCLLPLPIFPSIHQNTRVYCLFYLVSVSELGCLRY